MNDDLKKLEIENMRLKSAVKELATLNEISSVIDSTMTVEEISQTIMTKVVTALHAGEAAVHTFSEGGDQLSPRTFVRGKSDSSIMVKARMDIRVAGWIARYKRPLVVNDIKNDERFQGIDFTDNPISSLLSVPLSAKGKLIGALTAFNSRKPDGFTGDDVRLLGIIGVQSAQVIENARLYQEELRLRRLEGEVHAARKIQEGFLPRNIPRIEGFDIYGGSLAATETAGDFFDFILSPPDRLHFTLGDVSGKGLPAALLMSTIQGQVRLLVNRNPHMKPSEILRELNSITCQLSSTAQFATTIVGELNAGNNNIILSNGGHNFPMVVRSDGSIEEISESSLLIGMFDQAEFGDTRCQLIAGDLVAIASDGIEEAFNEEGQDFGIERYINLLIENRTSGAAEIYGRIVDAVREFRGKAEQSDDITLTIIKCETDR